MTRESMGERQVRLEEQLKAVGMSLATLAEQGREAAESRRRGYEAQEELRVEILNIKHRIDGLERSVEAIKPTSAEYMQVRDRVLFAGKLGGAVWGVGKVIISATAGFAAAWYSMTGRPPP